MRGRSKSIPNSPAPAPPRQIARGLANSEPSTHGTKLTIANVCSLVRYATRFRIPRADSQLAAGVLICCPGHFGLPNLGGVPLAIWPAMRLKSFSSHAAKAALALKAPSMTAFDANVVAHGSF